MDAEVLCESLVQNQNQTPEEQNIKQPPEYFEADSILSFTKKIENFQKENFLTRE